MEAVEEHPVINSNVENHKLNITEDNNVDVIETDKSYKSNGVDCDKPCIKDDQHAEESCAIAESNAITTDSEIISKKINSPSANNEVTDTIVTGEISSTSSAVVKDEIFSTSSANLTEEIIAPSSTNATEVIELVTENIINPHQETEAVEEVEISTDTIIETVEKEPSNESEIFTETIVEVSSSESAQATDQVKFETEIFVEKNDNDGNDVNENVVIDNQEQENTNNILSELGPNIELSEVFRSSDISENNNSTARQEVFNKEELLDILEGNDIDEPGNNVVKKFNDNKMIEAQIALQQLSRLKKRKKTYTSKGKKSDKKNVPELIKAELKNNSENKHLSGDVEPECVVNNKTPSTEDIVNVLVMDWEDDEPIESTSTDVVVADSSNSEQVEKAQEKLKHAEKITETTSIDVSLSEEQSHKLSKNDESAPRRLSRVIKKKVIFDPDNPDTFTKGKSITKVKEAHVVKEPSKKIKTEDTSDRSKSKSPLSKLQWKKPTPKNSKQCKRLSEVDKLLMDEGAVNMIYQLTPEAPKGRKNMRTKAEFIKKIQSSTPDGKEMKFRERKKESKYEDAEGKLILSGKHRISISGSVKSPSVSEDFETHSADDSIIYRRHSSSSYSSSCMSPRRLSDVEVAANVSRSSNKEISIETKKQSNIRSSVENEGQTNKDFFETESGIPSSEIINKDDCLSIKEKLNSKLSLALNKRKRESSKIEKPVKQKKILKVEDTTQTYVDKFKLISVNIDQRLAIISIHKKGLKICAQVLKELEDAFKFVDSRKDISVTLVDSKVGALCSSFNSRLLLDEDKERRFNQAYELAESLRSLSWHVSRHSKLVCSGVRGACAGAALSLAALCDVAVCAEGACFSLGAPPLHAAAVLAARSPPLPRALVDDLVIFGRQVSASEALQGGLISRVLWPDRFDEQVLSIAKDIAAQPIQTVLLKKKLLCLKKNSEEESTFLSCLETERDLLVEYWTSVEGQELLRATLDTA